MNKLIKHRGLHEGSIKENTYEAISRALASKEYVGVEFDVRETSDHEFIIYHDVLLNGKLISNMKSKDLPKYIPKLQTILQINSDKIFLIELKNIKSLTKLINLLNSYGDKQLYVMSFSNNLINKINVKKRTYKIGILNYVLNTFVDIQNYDFVAILNSLLNEQILAVLKDKEVFSYGWLEAKKYPQVYYIVD